MFDTKIVLVVRDDLATTAKAQHHRLPDERHRRANANDYRRSLPGCGGECLQPDVHPADGGAGGRPGNAAHHPQALAGARGDDVRLRRGKFATGHDAANREVFAKFSPEDAKLVGLALRAEKKMADKITKGAKMHP